MRDILSFALVKIAQKGNVIAKEEIIKLVRFTIDDWIERCPTLSSWEGYESLIKRIVLRAVYVATVIRGLLLVTYSRLLNMQVEV